MIKKEAEVIPGQVGPDAAFDVEVQSVERRDLTGLKPVVVTVGAGAAGEIAGLEGGLELVATTSVTALLECATHEKFVALLPSEADLTRVAVNAEWLGVSPTVLVGVPGVSSPVGLAALARGYGLPVTEVSTLQAAAANARAAALAAGGEKKSRDGSDRDGGAEGKSQDFRPPTMQPRTRHFKDFQINGTSEGESDDSAA